MDTFYNWTEGGDFSTGHASNPQTGLPYEANQVLRGDYTRVLAEFWADGPESETPPGHWFVLLNGAMDHPDFTTKWKGAGEELDALRYTVRAYLTLGGAMIESSGTGFHDGNFRALVVKLTILVALGVAAAAVLAAAGSGSDGLDAASCSCCARAAWAGN